MILKKEKNIGTIRGEGDDLSKNGTNAFFSVKEDTFEENLHQRQLVILLME